MAETSSSNPVSSPPPLLRPVGRQRKDGLAYQAEVTEVTRLRKRIMSTLKARLKTKLLIRVCPPLAKSRWPPSMSPGPAALYAGSLGAGFWTAPCELPE